MANTDAIIDSVRRSLNLWNVGVSGVGRDFSDVQAQLGGVGRTIFEAGIPLGEIAVGSLVKLNENGSPVEFYVAKHDYESGLNGAGRTLLVRKDCYDARQWNSSTVNTYASSALNRWLNNTYKQLIDEDIRGLLGTTKIRYTPGNGNNTVGTLARAIFQLSVTELGGESTSYNTEGTMLPIASDLRVAYMNGSVVTQWTRSPNITSSTNVARFSTVGDFSGDQCNDYHGSRPAFTLPASLNVSDDGTVSVNTAPGTPGSITVPTGVQGGADVTVTWGAATDADGNLSGYQLQRQVDGGSWSTVYTGSALTYTEMVDKSWSTVAYRVAAYDAAGAYSAYQTSATVTVTHPTVGLFASIDGVQRALTQMHGAVQGVVREVHQMFATIEGVQRVIFDHASDPNTLLLIHGDEIADASENRLSITNGGVQLSTSVTKFSSKSMYFDGASKLTVDGSIFQFGSGDFTFEFWFYPLSNSGNRVYLSGTQDGDPFFGHTDSFLFFGRTAVAFDHQFHTGYPSVNAWNHIAITRSANTLRYFLNGSLIGSWSNAISYSYSGDLLIGADKGDSSFINGYMEELRISDIARWTGAFTPPEKRYKG